MARSTHRVQFAGHDGNLLAGILELPSDPLQGFLLFSHCFTCNKDLKAIVRISRELAERGWGVLRYDFSGLGNSRGEFSATNFTTNRLDLRAAALFLEKEYQPADFLIGHSFGGAASMSMADELPVRGVIVIAAPSDTHHLAELLESMDPSIMAIGQGSVSIGNRTYSILRQTLDDFRSHDLRGTVQRMTKPLLVFHSPTDETVGFYHALINCGFGSKVPPPASSNRSLISLPNSNHLLTSSDADCGFVAEIADCWCRRAAKSGAS